MFGDLTDPQPQNRYVYCRNNPKKYTDPDGRYAWPLILGGLSLLYMVDGGARRAYQYHKDNPSAPIKRKVDEFIIGFDKRGISVVTGLTSLWPVKTVSANSFDTQVNNIEVNLGAEGYDDYQDYTLDEKFGDVQKDVGTKAVLNFIPWGDGNDEKTAEFIYNKGTAPNIKEAMDPWVLHIDDFKPISSNQYNPSNIHYVDPWRYGR